MRPRLPSLFKTKLLPPQDVETTGVPSSAGENAKVDLDGLLTHIHMLLEWFQKGKISSHKPKAAQQYWPTSETFIDLKTLLHHGINATKFHAQVDATAIASSVLQGMGLASMVAAGFLVVANILERVEDVRANQDECVDLLKEMLKLANRVRELTELKGEMRDEIKAITALIVEGSIICCTQIQSSQFSQFFRTAINKEHIDQTKEKLGTVYRDLQTKLLISIHKKLDRLEASLPNMVPPPPNVMNTASLPKSAPPPPKLEPPPKPVPPSPPAPLKIEPPQKPVPPKPKQPAIINIYYPEKVIFDRRNCVNKNNFDRKVIFHGDELSQHNLKSRT